MEWTHGKPNSHLNMRAMASGVKRQGISMPTNHEVGHLRAD
jgi:hypothetical protein